MEYKRWEKGEREMRKKRNYRDRGTDTDRKRQNHSEQDVKNSLGSSSHPLMRESRAQDHTQGEANTQVQRLIVN